MTGGRGTASEWPGLKSWLQLSDVGNLLHLSEPPFCKMKIIIFHSGLLGQVNEISHPRDHYWVPAVCRLCSGPVDIVVNKKNMLLTSWSWGFNEGDRYLASGYKANYLITIVIDKLWHKRDPPWCVGLRRGEEVMFGLTAELGRAES